MLRKKHLDALKLASIPYTEEWTGKPHPTFAVFDRNNIVDAVDFLQNNFAEDGPHIPLQVDKDKYYLYVNDE